MKGAVGEVQGMVFLSDRCKGLEEVVKSVWPTFEHSTCVRHLYKSFIKTWVGDHMESLVRMQLGPTGRRLLRSK